MNGIHTGPLPIVNLYIRDSFDVEAVRIGAGNLTPTRGVTTYSDTPCGRQVPRADSAGWKRLWVRQNSQEPTWKTFLGKPIVKVTLGLAVGIALLLLIARYVDIPATMMVLQQNLTTPRGIALALLCGLCFVAALAIRGARWSLFLRSAGKVKTGRVIQIFMIGSFLNFLLPVRGGEVAKSLILKQTAGIPINQSLPTVAIDKALDLLPALFIIAIVPLLDVQMNLQIWFILGLVSGILVGLVFVVGLAAWKRSLANVFIHTIAAILPGVIGTKLEAFAIGFVDSLLMGASRPRIFIPAILLTGIAVIFEGMFAMLAFWTIGLPIDFGTAIFGYTLYNMFYILPTPPGQIGSNEVVGLLVFAGLLHLPKDSVLAMFAFSHPWAALLMTTTGLAFLGMLGLTVSSVMRVQPGNGSDISNQRQ